MKKDLNQGLIATASVTIDATLAEVWDALRNPQVIKQYMFGTNVVSDWRVGSPIVWKGEWQGRPYEDKGTILQIEPERLIKYSHFSPLSGQPDVPENYHIVMVELSNQGSSTRVTLTQDHNDTEQDREHSQQNWQMMLESLTKLLENRDKGAS